MKTWNDWSDFDISKAVADILGLEWNCKPFSKLNNTVHWIYSDNYCTGDGEPVSLPDYCNNWSDMGPLIDEHDISLIVNDAGSHIATNSPDGYFDGSNDIIWAFDKKTPRAAAIVFLMMNGVTPDEQ